MTYELEEIKKIRKHLGLTQTELAKRANVSQSLIAKVETGVIDPTYSKAKKIFLALNDLGKKHEIQACQIMNPKIISIKPDDGIRDAIERMKRHKISQLPVISENKVIGIISESTLLDAILNSKNNNVCDVMREPPPIIPKESSINIISSLLKYYPLVLVSDGGNLAGLITKADLINKLYGK